MRRARSAVWAYFMTPAVSLATWTAREPAVKAQAGLSNGALSLGLLAYGVGGLVAVLFVGRLVDRYGSATVMRPSAVLLCIQWRGPDTCTASRSLSRH